MLPGGIEFVLLEEDYRFVASVHKPEIIFSNLIFKVCKINTRFTGIKLGTTGIGHNDGLRKLYFGIIL